jgi:protein tyrosine/serine phosphatase
MDAARHLEWEGCFNARDLGGLEGPLGTIREGALARSDNLDDLTDAGWASLRAHGVRTIVDLRDPSEHVHRDGADRPETVSAPVFDFADNGFWRSWDNRDFDPGGFYRATLERWPGRFAYAVGIVADAPPGGVLVHCHVGRDRTGLLTGLLLALAGIPVETIARDYSLSAARLSPRYALWLAGEVDDETRERLLREDRNGSRAEALLEAFAGLDVEAYLRDGGATTAQLDAVRERLL